MSTRRWGRQGFGLLAALALGGAQAQSQTMVRGDEPNGASTASAASDIEPALHSVPMAVELRWDPAHIRAHDGLARERLGLVSTGLLFEAEPGWWMGPVALGAASGQRGGFFVLGAQVQRRWQLAEQWRAQLGLTAGGGGGGGAPVGGGLLLQPAASLVYDWGGLQTGLSWSRVNMPGGQIGSQQWGLVMSWDGRMRYFDVGGTGRHASDPERTGLGMDRVMLTSAQLRVGAHADARGAAAPASTVRLLGARAERLVGRHGYMGIEAAAATHGGADGYMELLATGGLETSLDAVGMRSVSVGVRGAVGMGGGGAVRTGGGTLGKAATSLRWDFGRDAFVGLEAGVVRGASGGDQGRYKAHYAQALLGLQLDHPGAPDAARVNYMAWSASLQRMTGAARKDGGKRALETMGIKVQRDIGDTTFYLTGQAQSAFGGQAGAFSMGLAGLGWTSQPASRQGLRVSAELLAGAAGGGGVDTQGGAVAQGMAYVGYALSGGRELQLGLGRIRSQHGGLDSPLIDLSWTQHLGVGSR
ncbi:MAG: hypothetical protein QM749_06030 [Aquabacterium sp.]